MSLAWPLLVGGMIENQRLGTLIEFFGGKQADAHRAGGDVEDCKQLYHLLMDHWDVVREEVAV